PGQVASQKALFPPHRRGGGYGAMVSRSGVVERVRPNDGQSVGERFRSGSRQRHFLDRSRRSFHRAKVRETSVRKFLDNVFACRPQEILKIGKQLLRVCIAFFQSAPKSIFYVIKG